MMKVLSQFLPELWLEGDRDPDRDGIETAYVRWRLARAAYLKLPSTVPESYVERTERQRAIDELRARTSSETEKEM